MKKIILILILLSSMVFAKPMMITITKYGCNWCEMMVQKTLKNSITRAKLERRFRVVIANRNEIEKIPSVIKGTRFFPTTYIIENGKLVDELPGYMSSARLLDYFDIR